jgi:viroplasmin and RNaseH domain-containing protein
MVLGTAVMIPTSADSRRRGDAHPRVTNCDSKYRCFYTLAEARDYMQGMFGNNYEEVIKETALDTTPEKGSRAYYAVANGRHTGIREAW